jgi:hypothetical protein
MLDKVLVPAHFVKDFTMEPTYIRGRNETSKGRSMKKVTKLRYKGRHIGNFATQKDVKVFIRQTYIETRYNTGNNAQ